MSKIFKRYMRFLCLALSLLLSSAACTGCALSGVFGGMFGGAATDDSSSSVATEGDSVEAASMWLVKTEGSVSVTDGEGANVSVINRLGLFSGYDVATQSASYGWIDLDESKLTKMDEQSDVEVQKDGKNLTLTVNSGSLFFNITEPLAEDETLEIHSSTMVTSIRGTCGWVNVSDTEHMDVYILEGTVRCFAGNTVRTVTAGQGAVISAESSAITVESFSADTVPAFVTDEVRDDEELAKVILDASGLNLLEEPQEAEPPESETQESESSSIPEEGEVLPLPEDGDRIVLTGTLNEYSYEETVALQGYPDPNAQWGADTSMTYWIIVLDEPQILEIGNGDGPGLRAEETSMVSGFDPDGLSAYAGQHIIFSIDPQKSYWQSDTSMPMGSARTSDIHILG